MPKNTPSPWCRKVVGQHHDWAIVVNTDWPPCQPIRRWVREDHLAENSRINRLRAELGKPPLKARELTPGGQRVQRQVEEGWECFHYRECRRCRRKDHASIFKDECPVALGIEQPWRGPDPDPDAPPPAPPNIPRHPVQDCRPDMFTHWEEEPIRDAFGRTVVDFAWHQLTDTERDGVHRYVCRGENDPDGERAHAKLQSKLDGVLD